MHMNARQGRSAAQLAGMQESSLLIQATAADVESESFGLQAGKSSMTDLIVVNANNTAVC